MLSSFPKRATRNVQSIVRKSQTSPGVLPEWYERMRWKLIISCLFIVLASILCVATLTKAPEEAVPVTTSSSKQEVTSLITDASNAINDRDEKAYLNLYGQSTDEEVKTEVSRFFTDLPADYSATIKVDDIRFSEDGYAAVVSTTYESRIGTGPVSSTQKKVNAAKVGTKWVLIAPPQSDLPSLKPSSTG